MEEAVIEMIADQETWKKADASNVVKRATWRETALILVVVEEMAEEAVEDVHQDHPDQDLHHTEAEVIKEETVQEEREAIALQDQEEEITEEEEAEATALPAQDQETTKETEQLHHYRIQIGFYKSKV